MSNLAIKSSGLCKLYPIGVPDKYPTLREALMRVPSAALRAVKSRLSREIAGAGSPHIWALRDVEFEVEHGEVLGIIGRNGAGKSTLLKILSGITEPTAGYADIYGRIGSLLEVGTGFHPELTGRENIFMNGALLGMSRNEIKRKFDEIVAFADVERFLDTPVKRYSSGMYMRLAFAVAAHLDPEILLVDEVLAVGDAAFQRKCIGKMGDIAGEGRTVLFVSHNLNAVESLCKRTILLQQGRLTRSGPTDETVIHYLRTTTSSDTDQYWPQIGSAPGNDRIRLHRARVRPAEGTPGDLLRTDMDLLLEFDYWNLKPGACLSVTLHVRTLEGGVAFTTASGYEPEWRDRGYDAGLYRNVCRIPGGLLNDGGYRIELLVVDDSTSIAYKHEDLLVFNVHNVAENGVGWHGAWPGVLRPVLQWKTECLSTGKALL